MRSIAVGSLEDDKAEDITVIDLAGKTSIADYMIIASGRSHRHVSALATHLVEQLKKRGHGPASVEGMSQADAATRNGASHDAVRKRWQRLRARLEAEGLPEMLA